MSGFGTLQPRTGSKDSVRMNEVIDMHLWPADEWSQVRFVPGKILAVKRHWIRILAGKEKKEVTIPRYCLALDPHNENEPRKDAKGKEIKCPYCDLTHGKDATARFEFFYLANAIVREIQEDEPRKKAPPSKEEKKTGFKDIRSKSWTPVRVCRIPSSMATRIQELSEGNVVKNKKTGEKKAFDVTDAKHGVDIRVKFKPKGAGTDKYSCDKDERTPMTDEEKSYLTWALDDNLLDVTGRMDVKQATEDLKRMELFGADTVDEDEDGYSLGDDEDSPKKKKKKKGKPAFSDDDDDEDDSPKKKKKKAKPAFSDDEDDEDDEPKKKKKKKSKVIDDDDEDDAPKKKKKKKAKVVDDDDEDDEPKKKKSKKSKDVSSKKKNDKVKAKSSKKKKKSSAWDDDDE